MGFRTSIKVITPSIFIRFYKRLKNFFINPYKWEGVFKSYDEVPKSGPGFEGEIWVDSTKLNTINLIEATLRKEDNGYSFIKEINPDYDLLSVLVCVLSSSNTNINIVDFGGGMGISYLHLMNTIKSKSEINYFIVETKSVCEHGNDIFINDPHLNFYEELPQDILSHVDIIYINTALQYVTDYRKTIKELTSLKPEYVLLSNLSAGNNPTFVTAQINVRGSSIPYWFLNIEEVINLFSENGYTPIFINRSNKIFDHNNFPERYQMNESCNILFKSTLF